VEKALKAMGLIRGVPLKKTHSIGELRRELLDVQTAQQFLPIADRVLAAAATLIIAQ
jgi:HEPN domain-containing protein